MEKYIYPFGTTVTRDDYPYGRLKCQITFGLEYKPKFGFRFWSQTVNPKTGRVNAKKFSAYYDVAIMYDDAAGKTTYTGWKFGYNVPETAEALKAAVNTLYPVTYAGVLNDVIIGAVAGLRGIFQSQMTYCGTKFEDIKPLMEGVIVPLLGFLPGKDGRPFAESEARDFILAYDWGKLERDLESLKVPDFNPFKTTSYKI